MIIIGDTSGLVAALNADDPEQAAARKALTEASAIVVSPLVFGEIEHIITRNIGRKSAHAVNDWLLQQERSMRVLIPEVSAPVLRKARTVQNQYAELRLDLADAVNVVLAEQFETDTILTLDRRDFRAIRPLTPHQAFRLLPDDL
ncbi:PIN domain-containing protein [Streptomyces sp. ET3-23]|uniref:PIN domain-containing protein n=1 Tax=Streptomyces sp. ET3-23 TaxID=2885643 RepID=UPI001D101F0C|nr:PIN domain-containing protein [Streptomyces sp. ET3-23]MCC2275225.1 PIN domain-containing protein [Streptomyces sp. ET3-23]